MTENDIESTGSKKAAGRYLRVWPTKAIQDHIDPRHGCYTELRGLGLLTMRMLAAVLESYRRPLQLVELEIPKLSGVRCLLKSLTAPSAEVN